MSDLFDGDEPPQHIEATEFDSQLVGGDASGGGLDLRDQLGIGYSALVGFGVGSVVFWVLYPFLGLLTLVAGVDPVFAASHQLFQMAFASAAAAFVGTEAHRHISARRE